MRIFPNRRDARGRSRHISVAGWLLTNGNGFRLEHPSRDSRMLPSASGTRKRDKLFKGVTAAASTAVTAAASTAAAAANTAKEGVTKSVSARKTSSAKPVSREPGGRDYCCVPPPRAYSPGELRPLSPSALASITSEEALATAEANNGTSKRCLAQPDQCRWLLAWCCDGEESGMSKNAPPLSIQQLTADRRSSTTNYI